MTVLEKFTYCPIRKSTLPADRAKLSPGLNPPASGVAELSVHLFILARPAYLIHLGAGTIDALFRSKGPENRFSSLPFSYLNV